MKIVLDSNILFSALISKGKTRKIILKKEILPETDFYVPEHFFKELWNNLDEIKQKTELNIHDLRILILLIRQKINIIPKEEFQKQLKDAKRAIEDIDSNDVPFLALALEIDADIWSDDKHFQKQDKVKAWRTTELIKKFNL